MLSLPEGYRCIFVDRLGSTNTELRGRIASGSDSAGLWLYADEQLEGRGRLDRDWVSGTGNVHASVSVCLGCCSSRCYELSFVAGLSVYDCLYRLLSDYGCSDAHRLFLKWPNDVLLDGLKVSGILLEYSGIGDIYIIGFGINVVFSPSFDGVTNILSRCGFRADRDCVLSDLALCFDRRLEMWRARGFDSICADWLFHSHEVGDVISVFLEGAWVSGIFRGIDGSGFLLFEDCSGFVRRVVSGDVGLTGLVKE